MQKAPHPLVLLVCLRARCPSRPVHVQHVASNHLVALSTALVLDNEDEVEARQDGGLQAESGDQYVSPVVQVPFLDTKAIVSCGKRCAREAQGGTVLPKQRAVLLLAAGKELGRGAVPGSMLSLGAGKGLRQLGGIHPRL